MLQLPLKPSGTFLEFLGDLLSFSHYHRITLEVISSRREIQSSSDFVPGSLRKLLKSKNLGN